MTSTCQDLILDSPGCMAIARLMLEVLDVKHVDRLNEAGTCEICRRKLPLRLVNKNTFKEFDYETGSVEAGKCERGEFDHDKFFVATLYLCDHVLDRWALLIDDEVDQLTSIWTGKGGHGLMKRFLDVRFKVSPLDVAEALQCKRKFDAANAFAPVKGKKTAPMDALEK